jgi:hypothetical protein
MSKSSIIKSLSIAVSFVVFANVCSSQSDRAKEIQIRTGVGISGYNSTTNINYDLIGAPIVQSTTGQAGTVHFPVEMRFEITRRINVGLNARFGSYLYDPEVTESSEKRNNFWALGPAAEFNIANRDHFRWYAGLGIHAVKLNTYETFNTDPIPFFGVLTAENSMKWAGLGSSLHTGILWFIAKSPVGLNFNIGYDGVNLDLKEFKTVLPIVGPQTVISTGTLAATGTKIDLGLVFRIKR